MDDIRIVIGGERFILRPTEHEYFVVTQVEPYKSLKHELISSNVFPDSKRIYNTYRYESVLINGKYWYFESEN